MPAIIFSKEGYDKKVLPMIDKDLNYEYPEGLDLHPKSDLHKKIVTKIMQYASESSGAVAAKFDSWNEIDRTLTAYIDLDESEEEVAYNDSRKPVSIVFPYTYAMMESLLAYLISAFFQTPMFRFEGVSPEDVVGSILLEKVIDLHCNKTKVALDLHTLFRDSIAYGVGFGSPYWKIERAIVDRPKTVLGVMGRESSEEVVFEGNALGNIDPYLSLPDPNVPVHKLQDGEFFGWVERTNYANLLSQEKNGLYFNGRYLDLVKDRATSIYGNDNSEREARLVGRNSNRYHPLASKGGRVRGMSEATKPLDLIHMVINLIPEEWKLGKGKYPEKWIFTIAADCTLVRCKPLNLNHGKYPVVVAAPDFDGYSTFPTSRLEMLYGLQKVLDWMFNAHVANVRKSVNDVLIYDPYLINSKDINSPEAGKRIRIRRPGWGRGVKDAVMQLPINDITRQHVADSSWIVQWMQKIGAVDESTMGAVRKGGPERLSAAEFQGTQMGQLSRLGRIARVIGLQAMQDIGEMFAAHTQQLMTQEMFIQATGDWQKVLLQEYGLDQLKVQRGRVKVSPYDLLINYDCKVRDGSIPGGNFSDVWVRMFEVLAGVPELQQQFDLSRIFMHIARNNGAQNVQDFIKVKVAPDEQVQAEAQKGNIIPLDRSNM